MLTKQSHCSAESRERLAAVAQLTGWLIGNWFIGGVVCLLFWGFASLFSYQQTALWFIYYFYIRRLWRLVTDELEINWLANRELNVSRQSQREIETVVEKSAGEMFSRQLGLHFSCELWNLVCVGGIETRTQTLEKMLRNWNPLSRLVISINSRYSRSGTIISCDLRDFPRDLRP